MLFSQQVKMNKIKQKAFMETSTIFSQKNPQLEDDYFNYKQPIFKLPPQYQHDHERFVCYIKIKLMVNGKQSYTTKGSGMLIDKKYILTAAHVVYDYKKKLQNFVNCKIENIENTNNPKKDNYQDLSYVKQGLVNHQYLCKYRIKQIHISQYFRPYCDNKSQNEPKGKTKSFHSDFALLQVELIQKSFKPQGDYPLCLSLEDPTGNALKNINIYGYPVQANLKDYKASKLQKVSAEIKSKYSQIVKEKGEDGDQQYLQESSMQMGHCFKGSGKQLLFSHNIIKYKIETEKGISGGPIIAEYKNTIILIGVHKGKKQVESDHNVKKLPNPQLDYNIGVCCSMMMEQLNQLGYKLEKKPFIYSQKTLGLRDKIAKIKEKKKLNKFDRQYNVKDILVIISYDLTNLIRLYLSGNNIGKEGFQFLTTKKYGFIKSIYLSNNNIEDLDDIPQQNWKNIENVSTLSFSINLLRKLPKEIILLKKIIKFWVPYNLFKTMPEVLLALANLDPQKQRKFYIYFTKMFRFHHTEDQDIYNRQMIEKIEKTKTKLIMTCPKDLQAEAKDEA